MSEKKEKAGWLRRTTLGEPRLSEIVELYRSLGYAVHLEPVKPEGLNDECRRCYKSEFNKVKTVYIRKKK